MYNCNIILRKKGKLNPVRIYRMKINEMKKMKSTYLREHRVHSEPGQKNVTVLFG